MTPSGKAAARASGPVESARPRVMLLGFGRLGQALLEGLLQSDACDVVAVYRWSSRPKTRKMVDDSERAFGRRARAAGIPDIACEGVNAYAFTQLLSTFKPDILLVGSWGEILKPHLLNRPDLLVVNCHPSRLPAHRGPNPYASVLRAGETVTGVTFHLMDERVDTGPVLLQRDVPVLFEDDGDALRERCSKVAETMVPELMALLAAGRHLKPTVQNHARHSYFPQIRMEEGSIVWSRPPQDIYNNIRGLYPWLPSYTFVPTPVAPHAVLLVGRAHYRQEAAPRLDSQPAVILAYERGILWVSTADPAVRIGLEQLKLQCAFFFLPVWLTRCLGFLVFRPGVRLLW